MSKKGDANDYSRFKDIVDSDEEKEKKTTTEGSACRNCNKDDAKLKCSVCKKATYCNRQCQTSDWTYHRRICKKPEEKKEKPPSRPKQPESTSSSNGETSRPSSASSSTSSKASTTPKKPAAKTEIVHEDEDLENARGYKNGLPYFHREQSEHEKSLIGDIAPKKIEEAPVIAPVNHDGSAWNHAGTFEQRDMTKWAEGRLKELLSHVEVSSSAFNVRGGEVKDIKGDASICVVRGKKRFLFDFEFKIDWEVVGKPYKGKLVLHDIGNDGDYEIECKYTKKPTDSLEQSELASLVGSKSSKLQAMLVEKIGQFVQEYQAL